MDAHMLTYYDISWQLSAITSIRRCFILGYNLWLNVWHSEIVPGEPLCRGIKPKRKSQIQQFWTFPRVYLGNGER